MPELQAQHFRLSVLVLPSSTAAFLLNPTCKLQSHILPWLRRHIPGAWYTQKKHRPGQMHLAESNQIQYTCSCYFHKKGERRLKHFLRKCESKYALQRNSWTHTQQDKESTPPAQPVPSQTVYRSLVPL